MQRGATDRGGIEADAALMRAVAEGDRHAFAQLVTGESPRLVRFVAATLGNTAEAEEVAQEALLRLWRQAEGWQPRARIGTWLHQVSYRLAVDRIRRRRPGVDIDEIGETMADEAPGGEESLARGQRDSRVAAAIARLPTRQRSAILLAHYQELSQSEAAAILEISEEAYESLLARGRRKLKELLLQDAALVADEGLDARSRRPRATQRKTGGGSAAREGKKS